MFFDVALAKRIGPTWLDLTFSSDSRLTALFGPSGAGKTSVLNMIAGLIHPDSGHVIVDGQTLSDTDQGVNVPPEGRRSGYVFQDNRLFPHRRVHANLTYGIRGKDPADAVIDFDEAISLLGLEPLLNRWPATLSGGEARRVAIGRALLSHPRFLLLDEPLSFLDRPRREEILRVIERIRDAIGLPILYVSHDRDEVDRLAGRVVDMADSISLAPKS